MDTNATKERPFSDVIPADIMADMEAIVAAISAGRKPDPELVKRAQERADRAREEVHRTQGITNIAVDLIREIRDEE